jgi:RimJ/RimL family protein N-acetyltransferase
MKYLLNNQQCQRLKFRKLELSDFDWWLEFFKNQQAVKGVGLNPDTRPDLLCKTWFRRAMARYENNTGGMNVMIHKQTHELIGMCGLLIQTVEGFERLEIGYSVLPKYWGQGYASEASQKCRDFAFENHLADSLISIVLLDNQGSEKVALKNGMKLEKLVEDYQGFRVNVFRIDRLDWLNDHA